MKTLNAQTREIQRAVGVTADGIYGPMTAAAIRAKLGLVDPSPEPVTLSDVIDARTKKNLLTLEPKAQKIFAKFIPKAKAIAAAMGCEYVAISGTRGKDEQNRLYAKGRTAPGNKVTNARYGYSNHNFGLALDFGVFSGGKYLDSSDPSRAAAVHCAVAAIAEKHGIEWGGSWKRFKDLPHFEVKTSLTTAQKRQRLFAGKPIL